MKSH
jgi:hypothetical protein